MEIAELPPEEQPEQPEEPPEEPPEAPEEPQPKRRGRPRKADSELKRPRRVVQPRVEPEPPAPPSTPSSAPDYTERQLDTATRFFAQQLASLQAKSNDARRERWRALFVK
jgi:hypothetical protein